MRLTVSSFLLKTPKGLLTGLLLLTLTACGSNSNFALPALDTLLSLLYTKDLIIAPLAFINTGGGALTNCTENSLPTGLSVAKSSDSKTCETQAHRQQFKLQQPPFFTVT